MTQFEFLSVFISIVLAFGVSDILSSWGEQIRLRKQIRRYGLHSAWSGLLIIVMIQVWWSLWVLRERTEWTFPEYLTLIVPYLTVALIAYVLTPSLENGERDIKRYYYDNSPWLFSLGAVYLASWMVFSTTVSGNSIFEPGGTFRLAGLLLMVVLAVWKNELFHVAAVVLAYLLLAAWVAVTVFSL